MPRDARPDEKRKRRQRDGYRVLPDGEHEYKGDAYYGYDEMTAEQRSARGHLDEDEDLDYDLTNEYEAQEKRRRGEQGDAGEGGGDRPDAAGDRGGGGRRH